MCERGRAQRNEQIKADADLQRHKLVHAFVDVADPADDLVEEIGGHGNRRRQEGGVCGELWDGANYCHVLLHFAHVSDFILWNGCWGDRIPYTGEIIFGWSDAMSAIGSERNQSSRSLHEVRP